MSVMSVMSVIWCQWCQHVSRWQELQMKICLPWNKLTYLSAPPINPIGWRNVGETDMPAITICSHNIVMLLMLDRRLRCWTKIKPTLGRFILLCFCYGCLIILLFLTWFIILMVPLLPVCFHSISLMLSWLLDCEDVFCYLPQPILCQPLANVSHPGPTLKPAFTAVLSWWHLKSPDQSGFSRYQTQTLLRHLPLAWPRSHASHWYR